MKRVKIIILRTAGTNCDKETAFAFEAAGAATDLVHINEITSCRKDLADYHILAIPGGFTYGDDIASGKILANELKFKVEENLQKFIKEGKLVIGICNGFQILVKAGLLPNLAGDFRTIESTLTLNDSNKFEDRWVHLRPKRSLCVWTAGMERIITLPVAHGEGKFIPKDDDVLSEMRRNRLTVFEYVNSDGSGCGYPGNPNGSVENIAGICDLTGRVFGLMPHPERHISVFQHPSWTRQPKITKKEGDGLAIFRNGVTFVKKHL